MKTFLAHERRKNLRLALNRIIAKILRKQTYWDYAFDGQEFEGAEFSSMKAAYSHAEEKFGDKCNDEGIYSNGDCEFVDCTFFEFFYDRHGNPHIMKEITESLEYIHYHGDYAEHFFIRDYI